MKLQFIEAGEIVTTHGVKGEMKVLPWMDGPEILCEFDRCRIGGVEYTIESCRIQKTCNLLKLKGIDTMEAAQAMRGKTVELYREDIDDEVIFAAELIGMSVIAEGNEIGKIVEELTMYFFAVGATTIESCIKQDGKLFEIQIDTDKKGVIFSMLTL